VRSGGHAAACSHAMQMVLPDPSGALAHALVVRPARPRRPSATSTESSAQASPGGEKRGRGKGQAHATWTQRICASRFQACCSALTWQPHCPTPAAGLPPGASAADAPAAGHPAGAPSAQRTHAEHQQRAQYPLLRQPGPGACTQCGPQHMRSVAHATSRAGSRRTAAPKCGGAALMVPASMLLLVVAACMMRVLSRCCQAATFTCWVCQPPPRPPNLPPRTACVVCRS
jgi:hypothetical protein